MKKSIVAMTFCVTATLASAQEQPGSAQYQALHNPNSPYYSDGNQDASSSSVQWASRWGAIASDNSGTYGIVSDMTSKSKAQKSALQECRRRGGGECEIVFAYNNQCAAVGANAKNSFSFSAPSQKEAEDKAIRKCEQSTGESCSVYYSGCSTAVRVQ